MDIAYLLFLQDFRTLTRDVLTPLLEWLSLFAVTWLPLIPIFIYWCVDKKKGLYILASLMVCRALNAVVKLTACVYRPWIRDARILPAGNAIATATGYSFPSGHTTTATVIYGGIASAFRDRHRLLVWLCLALIVLTAFSRNYLGVHTPQDVLVGMGLGAAVLFGATRLFTVLEAHPELENRFLLAGFLFGAVALAYISCKSYPMDYGADGQLLVKPSKMMQDGFKDIGLLMGLCAARFVEKRWVCFRIAGLKARGLVLASLGFVLLFLMQAGLTPFLKSAFGGNWGRLLAHFILVFFAIALWPAVIGRFGGSSSSHKFSSNLCKPPSK